ncbi:hypothetical protein R77564_03936 [Ralstonia sp. LMG 32965]|uniref:Uncharacterized protein n=1 Tax=Ralstonia flatus TaxID=3058601 RepID=A0ABN9KI63_9RALS|nr:hypothetical protein R77564_03936 [Ralstonia sp. LMG 32965]
MRNTEPDPVGYWWTDAAAAEVGRRHAGTHDHCRHASATVSTSRNFCNEIDEMGGGVGRVKRPQPGGYHTTSNCPKNLIGCALRAPLCDSLANGLCNSVTKPDLAPAASECSNAIVGAGEAQGTQISVDLLERASLLARLVGLGLEPGGELGRVAVELAWALPCRIGRCGGVSAQTAPDRVPGDAQAPGDLAQRDLVAKVPASNDAQYGHVDHSNLPLVAERDSVLYVGQHSMQKPTSGGSGFGANQHSIFTAKFRLRAT